MYCRCRIWCPLFPGRSSDPKTGQRSESVTYSTMNKRITKMFIACGVIITSVCHAMRHACATFLEMLG